MATLGSNINIFSRGVGFSKMFDSWGCASSIFERVETNSSPPENRPSPKESNLPTIRVTVLVSGTRHSTNEFSQLFVKIKRKKTPNLLRVAWERGERSDGAGSTGHVQCLVVWIRHISYPYAPCVVYIYIHIYIWLIFTVNVGKYSIHGSYGL